MSRAQRQPESDVESPALTVHGDGSARYDLAALRQLPRVERRCTVVCATGDRHTARWSGVPVPELLSAVGPPPATTHLRLESRDGYRVCVPVYDALDGLVADAREGAPLHECESYRTRFVAPGVDGERLVKGLRRVEALALDPGDDPDRLENVTPAVDESG